MSCERAGQATLHAIKTILLSGAYSQPLVPGATPNGPQHRSYKSTRLFLDVFPGGNESHRRLYSRRSRAPVSRAVFSISARPRTDVSFDSH